ncbi:tetratricopeptide repeat protein, partial [Myxococcota bacterium]
DASAGVPPLPVPIPLPLGGETPPDVDLPELDLEELGELVVEEVVDEPPRSGSPLPATSAGSAAPAVPALDVPLSGNVREVPLPRLVYKLYLATFSGVVHLASSAANRTIYVWGGMPVRVDSQQLNEALGRMLLEHGRLTVDQYTRSLEMMQEKGCRQGEALIEMGAISELDLLDALQQQTEVKLTNSFAWREADYRLEARTDFARDSVLSEVHPLKAIWRGVHEHYDLDSLLGYFVELQSRYIVATELFGVYFETLGPFLRNLDLMKHLDGKTTFAQALQQDPRTLEVAQVLYVLLVTDMVQPTQEPGAAAREPSALSRQALPTDPAEASRLADEIAGEYLRVKESDYVDALRVDTSSSSEEVDAAYANIIAALKLDNLPPGLSDEVLKRAREIREILARARLVMRNPVARNRYLVEQQNRFDQMVMPVVEAVVEEDVTPQQPRALELDVLGGRAMTFAGQKLFNEGQSLMKQEKYAEAIEKFQRAIEVCDSEASFRVALGQAIWHADQDRGEATRARVVTCLQQALQLDPAHTEANLEMARLLIETGNQDRAYAYVQRVLQRAPEHQEARRLLASLG